MNVTPAEAAAALQDIDAAGTHSRKLYSYQIASAYLLLWGVLWIVAGVGSDLAPGNAGQVWLTVDAIGIPVSIWLAFQRARQRTNAPAIHAWAVRFTMSIAVAVLFGIAIMLLYSPSSGAQTTTFWALYSAAAYAGIGVWVGARYVITGAILGLLAGSLYWLSAPHAPALIAVATGGAMMLGGLWMQRA